MLIRDFYILVTVFLGLFFTYFNLLLFYFSERKEKKEIKNWPSVSIIVPAYNEEENIEETIKSLLNLDYDKDKLEIIIVDDGSKDNTYEIAKKYESSIVKVFRKENGGKASALNYGLKYAKGEFIVTMDADSIVPRDALKKMLKYFDEDTMVVVPAIQVKEVRGLLELMQSIEYSYSNFLRMIFDKLNSIYVAPGPFSVFRKKLFDIIGKFDEKNLTEDMEIAMRVHANKFGIRYCPEVLIKTKVPNKFGKLLKQRIRWYLGFIDNILKYRKKISNKILVNLIFTSATIFISISIINFFLFFYDIFKYFYDQIFFYYLAGFDIGTVLSYSIFNSKNIFSNIYIQYMSKNFVYLFFNIIFVLMFVFFILESWKIENEKKNSIFIFLYILLFAFMYAIFWIAAIYYKIFGKELRWGGVVWKNSLINKIR